MGQQVIRPPSGEDLRRLARQVADVERLAELHLGRRLANDDTDLDAIQEILDGAVLHGGQTYEL